MACVRPITPLLTLTLILSGCATTGVTSLTQTGRVGPDDGSDSCHARAVALDETGNFFGQDILTGAAIGAVGGGILGGIASGNWKGAVTGAAVGGVVGGAAGYWEALQQQNQNTAQLNATVTNNLTTENAQINETQLAFNNDMDCRFQQAQSIRQQYAAGQITQAQAQTQMAQVKSLAERDLALAQTINNQIQSRGAQFDTAVTKLSQNAPAPASAPAPAPQPGSIAQNTALYLRPDPSSPVVGQATKRESVTVNGSSNGYALVEANDGTRGFAPLSDVTKPGSKRPVYVPPKTAPAGASGSQIQQLDGSNAANRDSFAQSVSVSQTAVANGFQVAT